MKRAHKRRPHLFVALAVVMLLGGFGLMLSAVLGGRLDSMSALPLPIGFTTAAIGGMLLTRTPLAVFFLFLYALAMLILTLTGSGWRSAPFFIALFLILFCLPLARQAKA